MLKIKACSTEYERRDRMMGKVLECIKGNKIFFGLLSFAIVVSIAYLMLTTVNVPFMDYYGAFVSICEKVMNGGLEWSDFWGKSQHKNPVWKLFLVINIKYFHWNTLLFTYLGLVFQVISIIVLYKVYRRFVTLKNPVIVQIAFAPFFLVQFSMLQWELTTNEYSAAFTLRVLLFLISMIGIDNYLHRRNYTSVYKSFVYGLLIAAMFVFIGQMYFLGVYVAVICAIGFNMAEGRKSIGIKVVTGNIILIALMTVGLLYYFHGVDFGAGTGRALDEEQGVVSLVIEQVLNGTMLKGFIVCLGSSLFQRDYITIPPYIFGTIYLFAIVVFVFMYFRKQMYKKTYLPIMLLIYVFVNMAMFVYARVERFGIDGLCASRYIIDTKLAAFALFLIIAMLLGNEEYTVKKYMRMFSKGICVCLTVVLLLSNGYEFCIGRHRKAYHQRAVDSLMRIEQLEDNELHINQAANASEFRKAAELLKKYELSCFFKEQQ